MSKNAHFIVILYPYTAATIAQLYTDQIYTLHGALVKIISKRDLVFEYFF